MLYQPCIGLVDELLANDSLAVTQPKREGCNKRIRIGTLVKNLSLTIRRHNRPVAVSPEYVGVCPFNRSLRLGCIRAQKAINSLDSLRYRALSCEKTLL